MPVLLKILSIVIPVFSIIGIGYLFASVKKISLDPIIDVLLYLTIPALVVSSLSKKSLAAGELATVAIAVSAVVLGTGILSYIYLKIIKRRDLRGFYLPTMFMNSGNMAFPLALLAFGPEGLAVSVLYYVTVSILVCSLGVYIAKGKGGFTEIFKLPLIYAAIIGISLNLGHIKIPVPILTTLDMLGWATIPLMQVSLGYRLYSTRLSSPGISIAGSIIRIGGGFVIAYAVTGLLGIDGLNRKIIILSSTMPGAVINFIISHKYKLQSELVASLVATSTLLSVITTPIVLLYLI
jgi:hypothetical protein